MATRRRVTWSPEARFDLAYIYNILKPYNLKVAKRATDTLRHIARELPDFPELGRMVPEFQDPDVRERILKDYRLIYRLVGEDQIEILQIFYTRRPLSDLLPDRERPDEE